MSGYMKNNEGGKCDKKTVKPRNTRIAVKVAAFAAGVFLCLGLTWLLSIWHDITFDEIVFYLSAPLDGTSQDVMNSFYMRVVLLSVLLTLIFAVVLLILKKKNKLKLLRRISSASLVLLSLLLLLQAGRAVVRYRVIDYVRSMSSSSDFRILSIPIR